jgi:hypothetical protein
MTKGSNGRSRRRFRRPAPAGWRPDPTRLHRMRYWDGRRWTNDISDGDGQSSRDAADTARMLPPKGRLSTPTLAVLVLPLLAVIGAAVVAAVVVPEEPTSSDKWNMGLTDCIIDEDGVGTNVAASGWVSNSSRTWLLITVEGFVETSDGPKKMESISVPVPPNGEARWVTHEASFNFGTQDLGDQCTAKGSASRLGDLPKPEEVAA